MKILNKAKELESNMKESREKIKKITAEGVSGGGNVKITLNGDNEIVEIKISKERKIKRIGLNFFGIMIKILTVILFSFLYLNT